VRLLFTCIGATGHFHPLALLARTAQAAGHEVAFASGGAFCPTIEASGFAAYPAGFDYAGRPLDVWFPQLRTLTGNDYIHFVAQEVRVQTQARHMVPDVLRLANTTYRPDLIVRDAAEYGGCIAAEVLGVPHASVRTAYSPSSFARRYMVGTNLSDLRLEYGLPSDPEVNMPFRYLHLACEPPGFSPPDEPPAPTSHILQPAVFDRPCGETLADWVSRMPARPTVCATLGTFMNCSTDVFSTILSGLRDEAINLVVLVGYDVDPAQFGPQTDNVHIARYIPLSLLLPWCDLVIAHAGFSTLVTTLANGLASVLIPLGADQPENARSAARLGVALVVDSTQRTPQAVRATVRKLLADASYRARARELRDATARLPTTDHALALLERLAAEGRPLTTTSTA
jgi:UDP:flavonoid glycosyltransferase YjiC (YdhE family)